MLQTQNLSPLQVLIARLLGLTTVEMEERVRGEIIDNPALEASTREESAEMDSGDDGDYTDTSSEDLIAGDYSSEDDIPDYKLNALPQSTEQQVFQYADTPTSYDFLLGQLRTNKSAKFCFAGIIYVSPIGVERINIIGEIFSLL